MGKQDKKLLNNLKRYEEDKTKPQDSKVYGQKPVKQTSGKEKSARMYNS